MNLKNDLKHYNNNINLNYAVPNNNNLDIFDQTRNKYSMKFFEKFNLNNNNKNKGIKITNINEVIKLHNKYKLNNICKDIMQIYQKDKINLKQKNYENNSMNKIKTNKLISSGNNIETKNNNLSSSYSNLNNINNINSFIGINANSIENNNKGRNLIRNNFNTINLIRKNSKNIINAKLNDVKVEKMTRNLSNPGNKNNLEIKNNIVVSPINKKNNAKKFYFQAEEKYNNINKTSILTKKNDINKINDNNNDNNIIIDTKKLSIIDIPAPNDSNLNNNKNGILNTFKNNLNLTIKEKALYILINSPMIPLNSKFILSKSTNNLKKIVLKKDILLNYDLYLKNKIKYYEDKQLFYNKKIKSIFNATKIAEITLNFITSESEKQFNKNYIILLNNKEDYNFIYYKNYIKIIYYIINETFKEENKKEISDNRLLGHLYDIINKKGYKNIKDYLYFLFISNNNNKKENIFMNNIDKINKIIKDEVPKILSFDESLKMCRFIIYSLYLIKEIINFANMIKNTIKLKIEEIELIKKMKEIQNKFHNKYIN